MFRFFRGDPVRTGRIMDIGAFPWWTDPTLKAEFLQAVTVLTHRLDYALWPDSPALMHAQSLFWLGTAVAAAAVFYRRMLGATWVAAVAALFFAVDDARGVTVGFIANRNVLIAATFGVSALVFHDRSRRDGSRLAAFLAVLLLALALFSKEEGIGTCAYLAAYALFVDPKGVWRGCLAMLPYAGVVMGWRALRGLVGLRRAEHGSLHRPADGPGAFRGRVWSSACRSCCWVSGARFRPKPRWCCGRHLSSVFWWSAVVFRRTCDRCRRAACSNAIASPDSGPPACSSPPFPSAPRCRWTGC